MNPRGRHNGLLSLLSIPFHCAWQRKQHRTVNNCSYVKSENWQLYFAGIFMMATTPQLFLLALIFLVPLLALSAAGQSRSYQNLQNIKLLQERMQMMKFYYIYKEIFRVPSQVGGGWWKPVYFQWQPINSMVWRFRGRGWSTKIWTFHFKRIPNQI